MWDWISKIFQGGGVRRSQPRSDFFLDPRLWLDRPFGKNKRRLLFMTVAIAVQLQAVIDCVDLVRKHAEQ